MELYLPKKYEFEKYNPVNGQFLKGHIPWNKGKKLNSKHKRKISKTWFKKGNRSTRKYGNIQKHQKPVEMWKDDVFVMYFISMNEAERKTGIWDENIRKVLNGERKNAGGFQWKLGRKIEI